MADGPRSRSSERGHSPWDRTGSPYFLFAPPGRFLRATVAESGRAGYGLLRDDDLGPAEDEVGLLAGVAVLALLGDQQRPHPLDPGAADALVQPGVVGGADDGVVGLDAVAEQGRLDLARLDLDGLGPLRQRRGVLGRRAGGDDVFQIEGDFH